MKVISLSKIGTPVAIVNNPKGKYDGKIIRIADKNDYDGKGDEQQDPFELLELEDFLRDPKKFQLLALEDRLAIANYLMNPKGDKPHDRTDEIQERYKDKGESEFRLDCGNMIVLPAELPERVFVAGKSGSGKSCWAAMYIREYEEMFPERKIYLLSTHEEEKAYQGLNIIQLNLGEEFIKAPPTLEDFRDSLVIFDDVDNLQNKELSNSVESLQNDLLANSRKYNSHILTLHHHLMDYKKTRTLLNEANRVIVFPQGSTYHVQRYLKVYAGFSPNVIKKMMAERSRWICIDHSLPPYYVTENAVVILNQ